MYYLRSILRSCELKANRGAVQAGSDSAAFKAKERDEKIALVDILGCSIYQKLFNRESGQHNSKVGKKDLVRNRSSRRGRNLFLLTFVQSVIRKDAASLSIHGDH